MDAAVPADRACRGAVTQPAAASAIVATSDPITIDDTRGWPLLPAIALERRSVETSYHRTPMEDDSVGGSGNAGAAIWLRMIVFVKLLAASTPIAPGYGDGAMTTRSARIGWPDLPQ